MFEPVLLKNINAQDGHLLSTYEAGGGYQALKKALREHAPTRSSTSSRRQTCEVAAVPVSRRG